MPWKDEIEGVREFLSDMEKKQIDSDIKHQKKGNTVIKSLKDEANKEMHQIEYSVKSFNPFDQLNIKT